MVITPSFISLIFLKNHIYLKHENYQKKKSNIVILKCLTINNFLECGSFPIKIDGF